jgi:hypothetical protein
MIDEGTYMVRGVEAALGYTSGAEPKEQVAVELVILDGGEHEGKRITWYGFFTEKTIETTLKSLRTLGWEGDDLSDLSGIDTKDAYAVIAHEEGQDGKVRARVRWINESPNGGLALKTRMDEGAAKAFAERMRGHVLAAKQRTVGTPTPQGSAANGGGKSGKQTTKGGKAKDDEVVF